MFKEIEIKGLVTKMTLVEIDEETEESLFLEIGKFNQQGYFERILRFDVK